MLTMTETSNNEPKRKLVLLKINAVRSRTKLSVPSVYRLIKEGKFPKPINMGERAVAWIEDEIEEWLLAKLEERGEAFQKQEDVRLNKIKTFVPMEVPPPKPQSPNPLLVPKTS